MTQLRELYQQVIMDHNRKPRNYGRAQDATCEAHGHNPLCGDKIDITMRIEEGVVRDIKFEGAGCAICTASASMMTQALQGKTLGEARRTFEQFHKLLTTEVDPQAEVTLGKLKVFAGVREFPVRVKCATLPWHTFEAALERSSQTITTE